MATIVTAGPAWPTPSPVTPTAPPLAGRTLLDQHWRDLTFLHWRVDPERVAPLLPPQLRPDVYDGSSWVGLVPFRLTEAGFGRTPALPYLGSFPETNVRLYSVDAAGRRGVVFGSLESARLAFVLGARWALGLNYTWARMRIERHGDTISYSSRRRWPGPRGIRTAVTVRVGSAVVQDAPLADFLTARWGLHTRRFGRTFYLPNTHERWPLVTADLVSLDDELLAAAGLPGLSTSPPDSVLFSSGVHARFGAPPRAVG